MKFTILGGTGFIGSNLAQHLKHEGHDVYIAPRDLKSITDIDLGHVVYAIGLTGDFRSRPHDTIEAHVELLSWALQHLTYTSLLYLSSTRVYGGLKEDDIASEDMRLPVYPSNDGLYDLSKLLGESLCLAHNNPNIKVARLSNVYGAGQSKETFLGAVLQEVKEKGRVSIDNHPQSSKDYISVADVCMLLTKIVLHGTSSLYNVASGRQINCEEISKWIKEAGHQVDFTYKNKAHSFPRIDIEKIKKEFQFQPARLEHDIKHML